MSAIRSPIGDRVPGAARAAVERQGDVDGLLDQHPLVALGLSTARRASKASCTWARAALTRLPASARSGPGSDPSARRASATGARSPRCAGLTAARAARSRRGVEGLDGRGHGVVERLRLEQGPGVCAHGVAARGVGALGHGDRSTFRDGANPGHPNACPVDPAAAEQGGDPQVDMPLSATRATGFGAGPSRDGADARGRWSGRRRPGRTTGTAGGRRRAPRRARRRGPRRDGAA